MDGDGDAATATAEVKAGRDCDRLPYFKSPDGTAGANGSHGAVLPDVSAALASARCLLPPTAGRTNPRALLTNPSAVPRAPVS